MKFYLSILFLSLSFLSKAQSYALPNEEVVFSFILSSGALHELAADTAGDYLIFRVVILKLPPWSTLKTLKIHGKHSPILII